MIWLFMPIYTNSSSIGPSRIDPNHTVMTSATAASSSKSSALVPLSIVRIVFPVGQPSRTAVVTFRTCLHDAFALTVLWGNNA